MAWDTVPAPNYATFPNDVGNALGNLVGNYQQAQQGQQRTRENDIRTQQDQMLLDQSKAFAGGVPTKPDGTPDWSKIAEIRAEKGDINALSELAPLIQGQQNLQGANAPDPTQGGGGSGGSSAPAGGEGGTSKGTYSLSQMITMAENAGFKGEDAAHVAAIAMAESGGNPNATGSADEVGLTQINPHAWGFAESARDPQQAFNDAYQVYQKQGWGAWSTDPTSKNFTPGNSMARYLPQARPKNWRVSSSRPHSRFPLG
jgi:Lysozyme like domain